MTVAFKDFIKATTTSIGTGNIELGSSPTGFNGFSQFQDGDVMDVLVVDNPDGPSQWEVFRAIYNSGAPDTLTRGTFLESSTGSRVSFSSGTKTVVHNASALFLTIMAEVLDGTLSFGGTAAAMTLTTRRGITPYEGMIVAATATGTNAAGSVTLNVDGSGANSVKLLNGSNLWDGAVQSGGYFLFRRNASSQWILLNPFTADLGAFAPKANPVFTGVPTAPTPETSNDSVRIPTTAYVQSNLALYAPKANPVFTGVPTVDASPPATNDSLRLASTGFVHDAPGVAKAWVNFNASGVPAIRNDYNVTSITDHGTGDFTVTLTTALGDANLCAVGIGGDGSRTIAQTVHFGANSAYTTSSVRLRLGTSGGAVDDFTNVHIAIFGDA